MPKPRKPPLPVDRGWAWLVMIASFINITIVISFNRASGLFVTDFLDQFQESATSTTLAFGAAPLMFSLCNILLPSVLLPRFCSRTLVFAAGIFSGISVTCMAFAQSMLAMTFLFGIMGFSHGLIFVPQTVLIGLYFKKRLAFANAFAYMGMAAAAIFSPIIARLLLDIFGLQGTLLIYGAFTFNILPSALLLRPVSSYNTDISDDEILLAENKMTADEKTCHLLNGELREDVGSGEAAYLSASKEELRFRGEDDLNYTELETHENSFIDESTKASEPQVDDSLMVAPRLSHDKKSGQDPNETSANSDHYETSSFHSPCNSAENGSLIDGKDSNVQASHKVECSSSKTNSTNKTTVCDCFLSLLSRARTSIYSHPVAILMLLAAGLCVHTQPSLTYLPSLGEENGLSSNQVPYLLTTAGIFNLVGKLVIGYIADLRCCSKSRLHIVVVVNLALGVVFHLIRLCDNFVLMLCLSVALGILSGVVDFMFPVVVSDILGKEHIGHMMSAFLLANGVFMSTDHVIVGALKDATGFFYISYHYMGALILLGVAVFAIVPFVARVQKKSQNFVVDA